MIGRRTGSAQPASPFLLGVENAGVLLGSLRSSFTLQVVELQAGFIEENLLSQAGSAVPAFAETCIVYDIRNIA